MIPQPSKRSDVPPFRVMDVFKAASERQRTHGDVILLCVGQPSTLAPRVVRDAVQMAIENEVLGYTDPAGTLLAREAVCEHYERTYGVQVSPDEVLLSSGSSGGFSITLLAAFDAGDTVAITAPGYPANRSSILAMGCNVVDLPCDASTRYQPTVAMLEALSTPLNGLVVASPANPTGTIIEQDEFERVIDWCEAHGVLLISDEIYHGISYGDRPVTARQFSPNAVVLGSVSKFYSMTGWRLGWTLLPPSLHRAAELLQANLSICAPAVSQAGLAAAFSADAEVELRSHVERYGRNRELLLRRLPELGITAFAPPDGAFYAYCDISHLTDDSVAWCAQMLAATGVAMTPGVDFDPVNGHRFVRISFAGRAADIDEAIDRLVENMMSRK